MSRIVITGIGVVSPIGIGRDRFWTNLTAGRSGTGPITLFDASAFPVRIGAEVKDFDARRVARRFPQAAEIRDRKILLALAAAEEAVRDARLTEAELRDGLLCVGLGLEAFCLEDVTPYAQAPDFGQALARSILDDHPGRLLQTPLDFTVRFSAIATACSRADTRTVPPALPEPRPSARPGKCFGKGRRRSVWRGLPIACSTRWGSADLPCCACYPTRTISRDERAGRLMLRERAPFWEKGRPSWCWKRWTTRSVATRESSPRCSATVVRWTHSGFRTLTRTAGAPSRA